MKRTKTITDFHVYDFALPIDQSIEKLTNLKAAFGDKENLRIEFEYDSVGKPRFYLRHDYDETFKEESERLTFEANLAAMLQQIKRGD